MNRFDEYQADLDALIAGCRREGSCPPLFVVGHSMGGLITFLWALEHGAAAGVSGIVVSSPFIALKLAVPAWKTVPGRLLSRIYPRFSLPPGIPLEQLTTDSAFVRETAADPLYGRPVTARWFTELRSAQRAVVLRAGQLRLPVLFLVAGNDGLADPDAARSLYDATPLALSEWHRYSDLSHEVFNEVSREEVYADMLSWLDGQLGDRPGQPAVTNAQPESVS